VKKKKGGKEADKKEELEDNEGLKAKVDTAVNTEESSTEDNSEDENGSNDSEKDNAEESTAAEGGDDYDEDEEWAKHDEVGRKENVLETKSRLTHAVHAPFFPCDKFEWWWLYLVDKKGPARKLVSPVISCKTLVDEEIVEMKFPAPQEKGNYVLTLHVKSDSYVDCDYAVDVKLSVAEAVEVVLPKYVDTDDEQEDRDHSHDELSEYTEESGSDEDEEDE